jgi:hypothetical protein
MNQAASSTATWVRTAAIALAVGGLLTPGPAHAQIETIVDTLSTCEPGGGIGFQIGNEGSQDVPQDTGFRFTVPPGMGGNAIDLTVCVSTSDGAYVAPFAIFTDVAGEPGAMIDSFEVPIPASRDLSQAPADVGTLLLPGSSYWVVALRSAQRGTWWEPSPGEPGLRARLQGDDTEWMIDETGLPPMQLRALPEPAGSAGIAVVALAIAARRRAISSRRTRF